MQKAVAENDGSGTRKLGDPKNKPARFTGPVYRGMHCTRR
jgi:hypothetical protein